MSELNIEKFAALENARVERIAALVPKIRLPFLKAIDQKNPSLLQPLYQMSAGKDHGPNFLKTFSFDSFLLDLTRNNPGLPPAVEPFASVLEGNYGTIEINTGLPDVEQKGIVDLSITTDGAGDPGSNNSLLISTGPDGDLHIGLSGWGVEENDTPDTILDANVLIETRTYSIEDAIQIGSIVTQAIVNSANWQVVPNSPRW
jgi:hypothetical protein